MTPKDGTEDQPKRLKGEIRARLKALIGESDLRQKQVARACGVTDRTVRNWMDSKNKALPQAHTIHLLCLELGCTADELVGLPGRPTLPPSAETPNEVWFVDRRRVEAILGTTDPSELEDLLDWDPDPLAISAYLPAGCEATTFRDLGPTIAKVKRHIREHAPGLLESWAIGRRPSDPAH